MTGRLSSMLMSLRSASMHEFIAPRRPASWQSQELRPRYWRTASSVAAVLARSIVIQLPARFTTSLHYTQLQQTLNCVLNRCEQVVGKVVIKFAQLLDLYFLYSGSLRIVVNYVFTVRSLRTVFNQVKQACAQLKSIGFKELSAVFYTLPTGPNTTNKLNKGLSR